MEQSSLIYTSLFLIITNTKLPIGSVFEKEYEIYHYLKLKNFLGEDPQTPPPQHILKCRKYSCQICVCAERGQQVNKRPPLLQY